MPSPFGTWSGAAFETTVFPPKTFWIDQWLRPEDACLLVGREGIGKSTFLFQLLAHMTTGTPLFGLYPIAHPLRCLMVQLEGDKQETHFRLKAVARLHGLDWSRFDYAFLPSQRLDTPEGFAEFTRLIDPLHHQWDVIFLDPLYGLFGGSGNDDEVVKALLANLRQLKEHAHAALIIGHHIRKAIFNPKVGRWMEESAEDALGSRLLPGWFDTVIHLGGEGDTSRTFKLFKGRKGGYFDRIDCEADELLEADEENLSVWFRMANTQSDQSLMLLARLSTQREVMTVAQMASLAGVNERTIMRWLKKPEFAQTLVCVNSAIKPRFYAHKLSHAYHRFGVPQAHILP